MRTLLVALVAVALSPSFAQAGGSKNATLQVRNNNSPSSSVELLAVIVDGDPSDFSEASAFDLASFIAAGGRLVGPKGVAVFPNLKIGTHTVSAAYVPIGSLHFQNLQTTSETINLPRGTTTISVRGNSTIGATISVPNSTP